MEWPHDLVGRELEVSLEKGYSLYQWEFTLDVKENGGFIFASDVQPSTGTNN